MYVKDFFMRGIKGVPLSKFLFEDEEQENFSKHVCEDVTIYTCIHEELLENPLSEETSFVDILAKIKDFYVDDELLKQYAKKNQVFFTEKLYRYNDDGAKQNPLCVSKDFLDTDIMKDVQEKDEINCTIRTLDLANRMAKIMDYKTKEVISQLAKRKEKDWLPDCLQIYNELKQIYYSADETDIRLPDGSVKSILSGYLDFMSVYGGDESHELDAYESDEIEPEDQKNFEAYCKVKRKFQEAYHRIKDIISEELQESNQLETQNKLTHTLLFKYLAAEQTKENFYEIKSFALRRCIREFAKEREKSDPRIMVYSSVDPKKMKRDRYGKLCVESQLDPYRRSVQIESKGFSKPVMVHIDEAKYEDYLNLYDLNRERIPEKDVENAYQLRPVSLFNVTQEQRDYIQKYLKGVVSERRITSSRFAELITFSKESLRGILDVGIKGEGELQKSW